MTPRKDSDTRIRNLWIALAISMLILVLGNTLLSGVNIELTGRRLALPLLRLMVFISIGLAVGQLVEAMGWTGYLGRVGAPLFRFARLGPHCSAAFSTAFISGTAANSMLYDFWREEKINRHQLILTNLANQLPAFFLHLPTTVFIVLPLTGWAGGLYFIITFLAVMMRLLLVVLWGHWRPAGLASDEDMENSALNPGKKTDPWGAIKQKLPRRLMTIATYVVPIYIAVFMLNGAGLFDWSRQWMAGWLTTRFIPVEALSLVVLSFAAEFTSGFAAAGALLQEGVMTTKQAVLALLIGNVIAFPIRALRHQLPRLMGIFAPKLGLQILLIGQGFRVISLLLVGTIYYVVF